MSSPSSSSSSPRPAMNGDQPRSYLRRVAVPTMTESELASTTNGSSSSPARARRPPPPSLDLPASSSTKPAHYRKLSSSSPSSPIAGPSVPTKPLVRIVPDRPLSANFTPPTSYPPAPPRTKPTPPATRLARHPETMQVPEGLTKKQAYLLNKNRLLNANGSDLPEGQDTEKAGLIRAGGTGPGTPSPNASDLTTTWSISEETAFLDLPKTIIHPPRLDPKVVEPFSVHGIPGPKLIWQAGMCEVKDEMGISVKFRDLISRDPKRRTMVFFIRHTFCGQCQNFVDASIRELDPVALSAANIDVILISNGHWAVSKKYRELFDCPFPLFQDSSRKLYNYLGMTLMNNDFGSMKQADRARYNTQTVPSQLVHGIGNGLFKMPLRDPGKLTQLGGEFIFGPASTCHFAHRMKNTSDHWEAIDVAEKAGCDPSSHFASASSSSATPYVALTSAQAHHTSQTRAAAAQLRQEAADRLREAEEMADQQDWELQRESELDRIKRKKMQRRAGHLRAGSAGLGGDPVVESPPLGSPMESEGGRGDEELRMTRAEFEAEQAQRELERRWEEEEREAELTKRVEEEVQRRMAQMMLAAGVSVPAPAPAPAPRHAEYGDDDDDDEEEEEEESTTSGEEEGMSGSTDQDRSPRSVKMKVFPLPLGVGGDVPEGEVKTGGRRMSRVKGEVREIRRGS